MAMKKYLRLFIVLSLVGVAILVWVSNRPQISGEVPQDEGMAPVVNLEPSEASSGVRELSLAERKFSLLEMDPTQAKAWILQELDKGDDFQTGNDLAIGMSQHLETWPSFRVFLLDVLFLIDPETAAMKSRELVEESQSPDEWAVALRNVAKVETGELETAWLQEKAAALLRNRTWRSDPSAGYLNAFDVIVHTNHTALSPELLELCEDVDQRAVRHASFLTLDRLVQTSPDEMLSLLARSAGQYSEVGPMISNLMARADVRNPVQREALERYLLSDQRTADELSSFANVFPNANYHVSNNLLTQTTGVDGVDLSAKDSASLELVREWLVDTRFAHLHSELETMHRRLKSFVER